MSAGVGNDPVAELRARLARYTAERHPLQHATAQFHLGTVLLDGDRLGEAEEAFSLAAGLFRLRGARAEEAKALNGLGATLRAARRLDLAARAFAHAAAGLAAAGLPLEEGAARFNLGLVLREHGDPGAAVEALRRAAELLDPEQVPAQAAAAARELAATQLETGDAAAAEATVTRALELADRAGDEAARGAAANVLGLARLAEGRPEPAREALLTAVAANPRRLRPEAFAMAKANLALACERAGAPERARLAARQALGVAAAPDAVRAQATAILERLGPPAADLRAIYEQEDDAGRERLVREELQRTLDRPDRERVADMREWIDVHTASPLDPADVAERWLAGLLELPSGDLVRAARDVVEALAGLDPETRDTFRTAVVRAMARFHIPQWMRLQEVFGQAADDAGDPGPWR